MCLTPRVSSFDMPTEFDRIWDIEKQQLKKDFNHIAIPISEIFCLIKGLKTNRDVINLMMEYIFELTERDGYDDNMYLSNTKALKKLYEEYDKKNKLDIPISLNVFDDSNVENKILSDILLMVETDIDPKDEKLQEVVRLHFKDKIKEKSNQEFTTINKKKKKKIK